MHERSEIHPQTQPKPLRMRRALNYQELKKTPVKLSLNWRATSGKTRTQQLHPSETVHGIPGREGHGGAGEGRDRGARRRQLLQTQRRRILGSTMTGLPDSQWLCKALPALTSGRQRGRWEISGIAPWKIQLSPEGMPAFCLLVYGSLGVSPICSLQGLCHGKMRGPRHAPR